MAGLDGTPGGISSDSGLHPDSSSTTAVAIATSTVVTSGFSEGTVGESLLTSGTNGTWLRSRHVLEEFLNGFEIGLSGCEGGIESLLVCVELGRLAKYGSSSESLLLLGEILLSSENIADGSVEESLLSIPILGLVEDFLSELLEGVGSCCFINEILEGRLGCCDRLGSSVPLFLRLSLSFLECTFT